MVPDIPMPVDVSQPLVAQLPLYVPLHDAWRIRPDALETGFDQPLASRRPIPSFSDQQEGAAIDVNLKGCYVPAEYSPTRSLTLSRPAEHIAPNGKSEDSGGEPAEAQAVTTGSAQSTWEERLPG